MIPMKPRQVIRIPKVLAHFLVVLYFMVVLWSTIALEMSIGLSSVEKGGNEAGSSGGSSFKAFREW